MNALVQGEFLTPGRDDEEFVRDAMELPSVSAPGVNRRDAEDAERAKERN